MTTTNHDSRATGRKEATMATTTNPLDGLTAEQLTGAVRLLDANPAMTGVTLPGTVREVTITRRAGEGVEPGTVGVHLGGLRAIHDSGEGWRFGAKGCPFCS